MRDSRYESGQWFGTAKQFNTLSDLEGSKAGATGGGIRTMHLLNKEGQVGFTEVAYDSGSALMGALRTGDIHAAHPSENYVRLAPAAGPASTESTIRTAATTLTRPQRVLNRWRAPAGR